MGCFMYMIFGSSKDVTVGPTAIMSILTAEYAVLGVEYAILLAFICGVMISLFGILRLGFVIDFISMPVIGGFTSAASITIASKQLTKVFGIDKELNPLPEGFPKFLEDGVISIWTKVIVNWETLRLNDTLLGVSCVVVLLALRVNIAKIIERSNKSNSKKSAMFSKKDVPPFSKGSKSWDTQYEIKLIFIPDVPIFLPF